MSIDAILKEAEALSLDEQAELIQRLEERLAAAGRVPELTEEMKAELDRREAEADANPGGGYTWDEVVAYVRRKK
ncbi:MAG: putative addiction module component [Gemmataceae bacterium]|nr:putative addiction module component [Gemmataceae bacterium]